MPDSKLTTSRRPVPRASQGQGLAVVLVERIGRVPGIAVQLPPKRHRDAARDGGLQPTRLPTDQGGAGLGGFHAIVRDGGLGKPWHIAAGYSRPRPGRPRPRPKFPRQPGRRWHPT